MNESTKTPMERFIDWANFTPVRRALYEKLESVAILMDRKDEGNQAQDLASEILTWLLSPNNLRGPADEEYSRAVLERFKKHLDTDRALEELKRCRPAARAVDRRDVAVSVLEAKIANPKLTWEEAAGKFCPCDKKRHAEKCEQNIAAQVLKLQKFLEKLDITIPALASIEQRKKPHLTPPGVPPDRPARYSRRH